MKKTSAKVRANGGFGYGYFLVLAKRDDRPDTEENWDVVTKVSIEDYRTIGDYRNKADRIKQRWQDHPDFANHSWRIKQV
jgi:hypothetical protein